MVERIAPVNTSTLLVKGILAGLLGIPIGGSTIGIHFSEGGKVRITLSYAECTEYTGSDISKILQSAVLLIEDFIQKDVPIYSGNVSIYLNYT